MHTCEYVNGGRCTLDGEHGGVPDPDPRSARVEDFRVYADNDGNMGMECAHYARGCSWEVELSAYKLGELLEAARAHLAEPAHRGVIPGEIVALTTH